MLYGPADGPAMLTFLSYVCVCVCVCVCASVFVCVFFCYATPTPKPKHIPLPPYRRFFLKCACISAHEFNWLWANINNCLWSSGVGLYHSQTADTKIQFLSSLSIFSIVVVVVVYCCCAHAEKV